jgi:uncharacterized repeat protein (TIGR03803 family)
MVSEGDLPHRNGGESFTMKALKQIPILVLLVLAGGNGETSAQTLTTLHQFGSSATDGAGPRAGLVQGSDGYFYGTTLLGGTNNGGVVFQISSAGTLTTLWQFGSSPTDGREPFAGLVQGSDGYFYGTTFLGGTNNDGGVFRISSAGTLTTLHQFGSSATDGTRPRAGLVQGNDGYFYGTTFLGGTNNGGVVFQISSAGTLTTLWQFGSSPTDGREPLAGLVQGSDGYFYGTTSVAGTNNDGVVFRISLAGTLTTLHQFGSSATDGARPWAGLVLGSDGYFYGTTEAGGTNNDGVVFRISSAGTLTTLWQFDFSPTDGREPLAGLVLGSDGYFYGTTDARGGNGDGVVFRISSAGTLTTLCQIGGSPTNGAGPEAGLVQGSDGYFYGTTSVGGTNNDGVVFQLSVPLNPPANQISSIQFSGSDVVLAIPSVAGETYQLQFSSSMQPTNWVNVPSVSVTNSIGALLTLTNFGGAVGSRGFYRFDITP